jgi:nicotinic acid mononucleotide adenylyltransferase
MIKKIGIYIGAFDPIHSGHLEFAQVALKTHELDKLYFLVEPTPRYRQGVKALHHRVNMAILGVANEPKLGTIVPQTKASLDDYIKLIQSRFNDHSIALIIPDNALKRFFHLPNLLSYNFGNMEIVVGLNAQSPEEINLRLRLLSETSGLKFSYSWFKAESSRINSTEIKKKLKQGVKPDEISKSVWEYIVKQKLYAPAPNA